MSARSCQEPPVPLNPLPGERLRDVHRKAFETWPDIIGAYEDEYPETPWFSIECGEAPIVVEFIEGSFAVKWFDHRVILETPDACAVSATLIRVLTAQGFGALEAM